MTYEEDRAFQQTVSEGLIPQLKNSAVCVSLAPSKGDLDAKFCVELGAMIMLDKPILAIVRPDDEVPAKLALVADEIVVADLNTEEGRALVAEAATAFSERF